MALRYENWTGLVMKQSRPVSEKREESMGLFAAESAIMGVCGGGGVGSGVGVSRYLCSLSTDLLNCDVCFGCCCCPCA